MAIIHAASVMDARRHELWNRGIVPIIRPINQCYRTIIVPNRAANQGMLVIASALMVE